MPHQICTRRVKINYITLKLKYYYMNMPHLYDIKIRIITLWENHLLMST